MKSIYQNLKNGKTDILVSPIPSKKNGNLLIKSVYSLVSLGTEKMLVDFSKANMYQKAKLQPEKLKLALSKLKTDGVVPTVNSILNKLNQPLPLGYSNCGVVYDIGEGVKGFNKGDYVISNGPHAEYFNAPVNLCAKIPEKVDNKEATFTVVASVSLHSVRLLDPSIGETVYVFGLGLIGLITVQILLSNGCEVIAVDYNQERLTKAKRYGAETILLSNEISPEQQISKFNTKVVSDGVIIATNTKSNEPLDLASLVCRKNGKIILVGDSGLNINRTKFYNNEFTFQVSRSYGPGRYNQIYEEDGVDFPIEYVRWTVQRNFEAILKLLEKKKLDFKSLISHEFTLDQISKSYDNLNNSSFLGLLIKYDTKSSNKNTIVNNKRIKREFSNINLNTGFIGAGNYAKSILLPAFKKNGAKIVGITSLNGLSASYVGNKFDADYFSSETEKVINDKSITNLVIATQHDSHFKYTKQGFIKNKNIFVEKPICLNLKDLNELKDLVNSKKSPKNFITVGFNRRFSPLIKLIKERLQHEKSPKFFLMNINAGFLEKEHWTQSRTKGGGRILGEAIHFIDLARFLCGKNIVDWSCSKSIGKSKDTCTILLNFKDGSIANINYISIGHGSYPKEKITVFCDGKVAEIDNFKKIKFYNWPGTRNKSLFIQNKGQKECVASFLNTSISGNDPAIPFDQIYEVTKTAIEISKSMQ